MKENIYIIFAVFFFQFIPYSCHSVIDDELNDFARVPVLNGILHADSIIKVQLSFCAKLGETSPTYIDNALVIINNNNGLNDTLIYAKNGWYISKITAIPGTNYSCVAKIHGYDTLNASTTIPIPTEIGFINYTEMVGRDEQGSKISSFDFLITNNKTQNIYWRIMLTDEENRYDGVIYTWYERIYMIPEQDSVMLNESQPLTLFSNKKMKNDNYKVKFYLSQSGTEFGDRKNTKSYVTLYTLDESYYHYMKRYYIYYTTFFPTLGQSSQNYQLYSNVKNGLGLFSGISARKKQIIIEN